MDQKYLVACQNEHEKERSYFQTILVSSYSDLNSSRGYKAVEEKLKVDDNTNKVLLIVPLVPEIKGGSVGKIGEHRHFKLLVIKQSRDNVKDTYCETISARQAQNTLRGYRALKKLFEANGDIVKALMIAQIFHDDNSDTFVSLENAKEKDCYQVLFRVDNQLHCQCVYSSQNLATSKGYEKVREELLSKYEQVEVLMVIKLVSDDVSVEVLEKL